jgi:hypothetical protein
MRYMLLVYTREEEMARGSKEEMAKVRDGHWGVMDEAQAKGIFQGAEPLAPTATATTVRRKNGRTTVTDGPFAETKEQLAGYYILDCKDREEAIAWAAKIPTSCGGLEGCIEIRELRQKPARSGEVSATEAQYSA